MTYELSGVCASAVEIETQDGVITKVAFTGGCQGNATAVSKLVVGQSATEISEKLKGIKCGFRDTSCPDLLAGILSGLEA